MKRFALSAMFFVLSLSSVAALPFNEREGTPTYAFTSLVTRVDRLVDGVDAVPQKMAEVRYYELLQQKADCFSQEEWFEIEEALLALEAHLLNHGSYRAELTGILVRFSETMNSSSCS